MTASPFIIDFLIHTNTIRGAVLCFTIFHKKTTSDRKRFRFPLEVIF